jgi:putative heme-binding domain-containing protein
LLHIQKGRHYGFPPRHPQHLPDVIDEPSTFDYGPQHQSTCGFNFNEPVNEGGPIFGPAAWSGDALVTGESRGKLYRTKLVKTPAGYVARTNLLAALGMLTVDACIAADGGLVVCCHSGGPDWGSGPSGKGKLFKITYTDRSHSQPVLVWATGPRELRVEFDRPVEPDHLKAVLERSKLTEGQHVRAGDRFETLWPGYAAVQMQRLAARRDVALRSAQLTPDRRTLLLAIDPIRTAAHYALTLPGMGRPNADEQAVDQPTPSDAVPLLPPRKQCQVLQPEGFLPQHPAIDLDFDLTGCEAVWNPEGGPQWSGWLPHLDLQVAQAMTAGSAPHDALWRSLDQPGELTLRTQLDLTDMLRPAVQPGSTLDYELPPETVTVTLSSRWEVTLSAPSPSATKAGSVSFTVSPKRNETVPLEVHIKKEGSTPQLTLHWTTAEDNRPRPLPLRRLFLPWADASEKGKAVEPAPSPPPEIAGGSWAHGRKEFFGVQAACAKCHTISGQGGAIGPDLSNLIHRDYASVLRDIVTPSFALNPDHLSYIVSLEDGRTLTGVVNSSHGKLQVGDLQGVVTEIDPADVEEMRASSISTMPEGLTKPLSPERLRDLMAFLLMPPPQMPRDYVGPRPKPRTITEVNAVLAGSEQPSALSRPIRVVLVAGPKDHGPGEHDYPAWQKAWAELLSAGDNVEVATAWEWPAKEEFEKADVIVVYQHGDWDARRAIDVDRYLARGGGLVYIHWAIDGRKLGGEMTQRTALAALGAVGFRHGPLTLEFNRKVKHPVTRNFDKLELTDETYWKMAGTLPGDRLLATAVEDGQPQPQLWSVEHGPGRVFVSIPGHYSWTFDDPLFRVLLLRAIAWSAHEPVDRFNDLVWPGADLAK